MKRYLFLLLVLLAFGVAFAQDKQPKASPTPVKPEISLALTPAELEAGKTADANMQASVNALNVALEQSLRIANDEEAQKLGWKVSSLMNTVSRAKVGWDKWLGEAQRAHGCVPNGPADCQIRDGKFVRIDDKK
jgi:hypothetical protein